MLGFGVYIIRYTTRANLFAKKGFVVLMKNTFPKVLMASACLIMVGACSPNAGENVNSGLNQNTIINTGGDAVADTSLHLDTYNPGKKSIFPVTSTLVSGPTEAILIDAQFQKDDAKAVVDMIQASGKPLKSVYISHGDPDFYFGLDEITKAFPEAKIEATTETRAYIEKSMKPKNAHWGPILNENAPSELILPEEIESDTLRVDDIEIKIMGLDGPDAKHSFVWIPSSKTILGGVSLFENMHVWMADSQTQTERNAWRDKLDMMLELNPETVIPGHYVGKSAKDITIIRYMKRYLTDFETAAEMSNNSDELKAEMIKKYPDAGGLPVLETSAKVITGEMSWP